METEDAFINSALKLGYGYYEILIVIFLKKFKFLREPNFGHYLSVKYSWAAQEHLIEAYSERTKIKIIFLEESGNLEVYFEKSYSIFNKKIVALNELVPVTTLPDSIKKKITLDTVEEILTTYAILFETHLDGVLRGEHKF